MEGFRKYELEEELEEKFDDETFDPFLVETDKLLKEYQNVDIIFDYDQMVPDLLQRVIGVQSGGEDYYDNDLANESMIALDQRYGGSEYIYDDNGNKVFNDPLENWSPINLEPEDIIFEAGHLLGLENNLGGYFRLLSDINFARGYWLGCVETAVSKDDAEALKLVSSEIDMLRPGTSEKEMENITQNLFIHDVGGRNLSSMKRWFDKSSFFSTFFYKTSYISLCSNFVVSCIIILACSYRKEKYE